MVIAILFLMLQLTDAHTKCQDLRVRQQEQVSEAARLLILSRSQENPLYALEHVMKAKIYLDQVVDLNNGSSSATERMLKLKLGEVEDLRTMINDRILTVKTFFMHELVAKKPSLDAGPSLSKLAGLADADLIPPHVQPQPLSDKTLPVADSSGLLAPIVSGSRKKKKHSSKSHAYRLK